jgi:D-galactose 1-dehydrogenase
VSDPIRIALVGFGKIARDQHVAAIAATGGIELVAVLSEHGAGPGHIPVFRSLAELAAADLGVTAASHCNTPAARYRTARDTLALGWATLLEKPPFATLTQCHELAALAASSAAVLCTSWHSQHNAAVEAARAWLADKTIRTVRLDWIEDVRKWHPGQDWIWQPGGFGVFDPGINGISILTRIMPFPVYPTAAHLLVPANRAMPIAADVDLAGASAGFTGTLRLDWRGGAEEQWNIAVSCAEGELQLTGGGRQLVIDGAVVAGHGDSEYPSIYAGFVEAVRAGVSRIDLAPITLVADAFLLASHERTEAFED